MVSYLWVETLRVRLYLVSRVSTLPECETMAPLQVAPLHVATLTIKNRAT